MLVQDRFGRRCRYSAWEFFAIHDKLCGRLSFEQGTLATGEAHDLEGALSITRNYGSIAHFVRSLSKFFGKPDTRN
jgi:hypothetical protein